MTLAAFNLGAGFAGGVVFLTSAIGSTLMTALAAIFAAVVDAAGWQGRQRMAALIGAALLGSVIGQTLEALIVHDAAFGSSPFSAFALWWGNFGSSLAFITGAVLVYDYHLRARRRAAALHDLRMRAATAGRRAALVRLQAMQARIDPRFLFEALAAIERDYEDDPALGDRLLDRLIAWLRAMLPDLHNAASTLGRELDRATMWAELQSMVRRRPLVLTVEADDDVRAARFPSMIVIPLVEAVLAAMPTARTMNMRAERSGARIALRIHCVGIGHAPVLESLRRQLAELYGDAATLSWTESAEHCEATVEIDDEEPQSDHR